MVSLVVVFLRGHDVPLGAEMNTEMTFFAQIFFNLDIAFHNLSPIDIYLKFITLADALLRKMFRMSSLLKEKIRL
jgi:hypothetical protein